VTSPLLSFQSLLGKGRTAMIDQLATDPGAWHIIWVTVVIVVVFAFVSWAMKGLQGRS